MRRQRSTVNKKPAQAGPVSTAAKARNSELPPYAWDVLISLFLVLATVLAFEQLCASDFEFFGTDDDEYVTQNAHVLSGPTAENLRWAATAFHSNNWHPLTWISLQIDCELFGPVPWGFRLTNIAFHAANAVLLFLVLSYMTGQRWPSALAAALFALHPLHVESVAWIAERKDVLSTFFWLLTMGAYAWYAKRPSVRRYLLVVALFAVGLTAKQMLVTLPCVLLLLDYWPLGRLRFTATASDVKSTVPLAKLILEKLPLQALAAASSLLTVLAQHEILHDFVLFPVEERISNALISYWQYIGQMIWPANLAAFYAHPENGWPIWQGAVAGLALLAITILLARLAVKPRPETAANEDAGDLRYLLVGWLWFLGTLVPVIGLVQVGMQAMADRYTYVPLIGLFIMLAWGCRDLAQRWPAFRAAAPWLAAGVLTACFVLTRTQVGYWQNSLTVWSHTVSALPDNKVAHNGLGVTFLQRGLPDDARRELQAALAIDPHYADANVNLALLYRMNGEPMKAIACLTPIVEAHPNSANMRLQLGLALLQTLGRQEDAVAQLTKALELAPNWPAAQAALGRALLLAGRPREALRNLTAAVESDPTSEEALMGLGQACLILDQPQQAESAFQALQRLGSTNPYLPLYAAYVQLKSGQSEEARRRLEQVLLKHPERPMAMANDAWLLATHPDPKARNGRLAVLRAEVACAAVAEKPQPRLLDALAAAHAELGQFPEAIAAARKAEALANAAGDKGLAEEIHARLQLYLTNQPFHQTSAETDRH